MQRIGVWSTDYNARSEFKLRVFAECNQIPNFKRTEIGEMAIERILQTFGVALLPQFLVIDASTVLHPFAFGAEEGLAGIEQPTRGLCI